MWFFDWVAGLFGVSRGEFFIYLSLFFLGFGMLSGGSDGWDDDEGSSVDRNLDKQNSDQNNYYNRR